MKRGVGGLIDRQLPRRADAVVTVTEGMRNWLVDVGGVAPERCISIPNGVEFRHFAAGARHGVLDWDEPRVVFAGNLADLFQQFVDVGAYTISRGTKTTGSILIEQMAIAGT